MLPRGLMLGFVAAALVASPAAAYRESDKAQDDKLICKKTQETGSMLRKRKQCFTWVEWERIAESQRTGATKMVDELRGRPPGS